MSGTHICTCSDDTAYEMLLTVGTHIQHTKTSVSRDFEACHAVFYSLGNNVKASGLLLRVLQLIVVKYYNVLEERTAYTFRVTELV